MVAPQRAALLLERRFRTPSSTRRVCIVLVDELAYIVTLKQDVIYNLFDWPSRRHARLVVVGVANTMDLPERLMPRVASRLGVARVTFAPYTRAQLDAIVRARLSGVPTFDREAIELCSRKVASVSGDVRRALQICRRAADLCAEAVRAGKVSEPVVRMAHINQAVEDLFTSNHVAVLRKASVHERILLASVILEGGNSGGSSLEAVPFSALQSRHGHACRARGLRELSASELWGVCRGLAELCVLSLEEVRYQRFANVRINVLRDDVFFAFRGDELWHSLLGALAGR
jgi:origin recognition complex subunit 1